MKRGMNAKYRRYAVWGDYRLGRVKVSLACSLSTDISEMGELSKVVSFHSILE